MLAVSIGFIVTLTCCHLLLTSSCELNCRVIMKTSCEKLEHKAIVLPTDRWNSIVNQCYEKFCTAKARDQAASQTGSNLSNTLRLLQDFSTVVECKRSMKAGDVGRVLMVWKKWSVMAQAITGLTNYSSYLPQMVLLLTQFLPPALRRYLQAHLRCLC